MTVILIVALTADIMTTLYGHLLDTSMKMSKSAFKAHALEVFREIERTGEPMIITDHGKPKLEIRKLAEKNIDLLQKLKGSVVRYEAPTEPIETDDWENA